MVCIRAELYRYKWILWLQSVVKAGKYPFRKDVNLNIFFQRSFSYQVAFQRDVQFDGSKPDRRFSYDPLVWEGFIVTKSPKLSRVGAIPWESRQLNNLASAHLAGKLMLIFQGSR